MPDLSVASDASTEDGHPLDAGHAGNAAAAILALARVHGVSDAAEPIDAFADAVSRLSDADVDLDHIERLLLALARRAIVTDQQRFALHAAYLHQKA